MYTQKDREIKIQRGRQTDRQPDSRGTQTGRDRFKRTNTQRDRQRITGTEK